MFKYHRLNKHAHSGCHFFGCLHSLEFMVDGGESSRAEILIYEGNVETVAVMFENLRVRVHEDKVGAALMECMGLCPILYQNIS